MSHVATRPAVRSARAGRPTTVRVEIQALRAVAVLLVLLYHLWPNRLPGGYIGVDVFFVISGFLITSHLVREIDRTGRVSLAAFWARRARRLLPASLLVLLVVALTIVLVVPDTYWQQYFREIGASALYVENLLLASNAVNYLAAAYAASPVQHFWSLSAEEQFYLLWPLLLVGALLVARGRSVRTRRRLILAVLATLTAASFVASVVWTSRVPASAYFLTPTRVWEFGAGGVVGVLALRSPGPRLASLLSWSGLAVIGISALLLTGSSPFPGALALGPVLGTIAVIAAGDPQHVLSPTRLARWRAVQFLGDVSYPVYLRHWPMIVLVPIILSRPLAALDKLVIIVASIVLAYLTKVGVEDPFRYRVRLVTARPRWTFAAVVAGAAVLVAGCGASLSVLDARNAREADRIVAATEGSCFGAAALESRNDCQDPFTLEGAMTPAFAVADTNLVADPGGGWKCEVPQGESEIRRCVLGDESKPVRTIAMIGDSHAMHLMEPMRVLAEKNGWRVVTYFKSACSGTGAADVMLGVRSKDTVPCATWGAAALAEIAADPAIDTVITSNVSSAYTQDDGTPIRAATYQAAWAGLLDAGKKLLVVADVPRTNGSDIPACLAAAGAAVGACDVPESAAFPPDAMAEAARTIRDDRVSLLDLSDHFCSDGVCHAVVGGVVVYSDSSHLTNTYAGTLAPYIALALLG